MTDISIVSQGEFNTGRKYTAEGQRIVWAQFNDGAIYFRDRSRLIDGWIDAALATDSAEVLALYDANKYSLKAPSSEHHMAGYEAKLA
jgi:hypothetical protein